MAENVIDNDMNGPFVRASRSAGDAQTETVYAIRVSYQSGDVEWWNAQVDPFSETEVAAVRQSAYRHGQPVGGKKSRVLNVEAVSREVTISAGPWTSDANPV